MIVKGRKIDQLAFIAVARLSKLQPPVLDGRYEFQRTLFCGNCGHHKIGHYSYVYADIGYVFALTVQYFEDSYSCYGRGSK